MKAFPGSKNDYFRFFIGIHKDSLRMNKIVHCKIFQFFRGYNPCKFLMNQYGNIRNMRNLDFCCSSCLTILTRKINNGEWNYSFNGNKIGLQTCFLNGYKRVVISKFLI